MITITNGKGETTIEWETYNQIMRERYINGLQETWHVVIGSIDSAIDKTMDETQLVGLLHAKVLLKEAIREHRSKFMG